jgi:hypothetical protein
MVEIDKQREMEMEAAQEKTRGLGFMVAAALLVFFAAVASVVMMLPKSDYLTTQYGMRLNLLHKDKAGVVEVVGFPDRKYQYGSDCDVAWYYDFPPTRKNWSAERDYVMTVSFKGCRVNKVTFGDST